MASLHTRETGQIWGQLPALPPGAVATAQQPTGSSPEPQRPLLTAVQTPPPYTAPPLPSGIRVPSLALLGLQIQPPDDLQADSRLPGLGKLPRLRTSVRLLLWDVEAPLLGGSQEAELAPPPGAHILKGLNTLRALEATPQRCQTEPRSLPGEAAPRTSWTSRGTCLPSRFRSLFPNAFTRASFGGDARFLPYGTRWNMGAKSKCGPRSKYIQNLQAAAAEHETQPRALLSEGPHTTARGPTSRRLPRPPVSGDPPGQRPWPQPSIGTERAFTPLHARPGAQGHSTLSSVTEQLGVSVGTLESSSLQMLRTSSVMQTWGRPGP